MERKIGEQFEYDGITLEVVNQLGCKGCYFLFKKVCIKDLGIIGYCGSSRRTDKKPVIFKEVTK